MGTRDPTLGPLARRVLEARYLLRDRSGKLIETPLDLFRRVARHVAEQDEEPALAEARYFDLLARQEFMPNSPTLMNAGRPGGMLPGCFVLPLEDSLEAVFDTKRVMARILDAGGGVGMSLGRLRPKGDAAGRENLAAGPLDILASFSADIELFASSRRRRGAAMGMLPVWHPDIREFVTCKRVLLGRHRSLYASVASRLDGAAAADLERRLAEIQLPNFNLSVAVTDEFMAALAGDKPFDLRNPRTMRVVERVSAHRLWDLIVEHAWLTGDPGLFFVDRANRLHPLSQAGRIEATNPCGEQPLLPYESCNLGSLNAGRFLDARGPRLDWGRLARAIAWAVRFLDDCVDASAYPDFRFEAMALRNRKVGLGIMGLADLLVGLGIPYDSEEGVALGARLMAFVDDRAHEASSRLAERRGVFPNYELSRWKGQGRPMRNGCVTTVAPTGTVSLFADCSPGLEPIFALAYRRFYEETEIREIYPPFERAGRLRGFLTADLVERIMHNDGSCRGVEGVPEDVQRIFATAHDVAPEWHVRMQAAFQAHCDAAVSKTLNLPEQAPREAVGRAYQLAWELGCKGITVYRAGTRHGQVLSPAGPEPR